MPGRTRSAPAPAARPTIWQGPTVPDLREAQSLPGMVADGISAPKITPP
ncbi:hypothetical protein [Pseudogemmobacter bohemicus]|nr:hypothetical protein [Pseudogemmobacter bohemicus]